MRLSELFSDTRRVVVEAHGARSGFNRELPDDLLDLVEQVADTLDERRDTFASAGPTDALPVTQLEHYVTVLVDGALRMRVPDHAFWDEELVGVTTRNPGAEFIWLQDAIDATKAYVEEDASDWGTSLCLFRRS